MSLIQITQDDLRQAMLASPGCPAQAWELLKAERKPVNLADVRKARVSGELLALAEERLGGELLQELLGGLPLADGELLRGTLEPGTDQVLDPGESVTFPFDDAVQTKPLLVDDNGLVVVAVESTSKRENTAGHVYDIGGEDLLARLEFQNGPVPANGLNGITNESLLVALIDRTEVLDKQFPCPENKAALKGMRAALAAFNARTEARKARGVEGKAEA